MLPVKVKMRRFCEFTETWVVTQRDINRIIKARKSKSTEQYDCKLFFRLDGTCNSIVELSNSKSWDFESTIKFNASAGEEYCEWFVCGTEVAFNITQANAGRLHSFLSFLPKTSKLRSAGYSEWKQFCLTLHCCWPPFANRQNCSHNWHNRTAKHIKISSSSRVITKPFMTFMNTSTNNYRHPYFTSFIVSLISSWAGLLLEVDRYFHVHSQAPRNARI